MPPGVDPDLFWLTNGVPPAIVMIVFLALLASTVILWPVMRALARRLEGKSTPDPSLRADVDDLQRRLGEVDTLQMRVSELEERLDFAERLLTRGQETRS
jgi:hypothetical protein